LPVIVHAAAMPFQKPTGERQGCKQVGKLLVADTDVAMDRITQIAARYGGYLLSSRVLNTAVEA
jgi:hypothetical protein